MHNITNSCLCRQYVVKDKVWSCRLNNTHIETNIENHKYILWFSFSFFFFFIFLVQFLLHTHHIELVNLSNSPNFIFSILWSLCFKLQFWHSCLKKGFYIAGQTYLLYIIYRNEEMKCSIRVIAYNYFIILKSSPVFVNDATNCSK